MAETTAINNLYERVVEITSTDYSVNQLELLYDTISACIYINRGQFGNLVLVRNLFLFVFIKIVHSFSSNFRSWKQCCRILRTISRDVHLPINYFVTTFISLKYTRLLSFFTSLKDNKNGSSLQFVSYLRNKKKLLIHYT